MCGTLLAQMNNPQNPIKNTIVETIITANDPRISPFAIEHEFRNTAILPRITLIKIFVRTVYTC